MEPIKLSELTALLENDDTCDEALEKYFDLHFKGPFAGEYQLKEGVEVLPETDGPATRGGGGLMELIKDIANQVARNKRNRKYHRTIKKEPHRIKVVSEGDSWFQHPLPKVREVIDHLIDTPDFAIYSLGAGGDELKNMFKEEEYQEVILRENPDFFLLSAGGNDVLGTNFHKYIKNPGTYPAAPVGTDPKRFIDDLYFIQMEEVVGIFKLTFQKLLQLKPNLQILTHGYSYIIPENNQNKGWVGRYLIDKGITVHQDRQAVINLMIDIFNEELQKAIEPFDQVHFVDLRQFTLPGEYWHDEIHPNSKGFRVYANMFSQKMLELKRGLG